MNQYMDDDMEGIEDEDATFLREMDNIKIDNFEVCTIVMTIKLGVSLPPRDVMVAVLQNRKLESFNTKLLGRDIKLSPKTFHKSLDIRIDKLHKALGDPERKRKKMFRSYSLKMFEDTDTINISGPCNVDQIMMCMFYLHSLVKKMFKYIYKKTKNDPLYIDDFEKYKAAATNMKVNQLKVNNIHATFSVRIGNNRTIDLSAVSRLCKAYFDKDGSMEVHDLVYMPHGNGGRRAYPGCKIKGLFVLTNNGDEVRYICFVTIFSTGSVLTGSTHPMVLARMQNLIKNFINDNEDDVVVVVP